MFTTNFIYSLPYYIQYYLLSRMLVVEYPHPLIMALPVNVWSEVGNVISRTCMCGRNRTQGLSLSLSLYDESCFVYRISCSSGVRKLDESVIVGDCVGVVVGVDSECTSNSLKRIVDCGASQGNVNVADTAIVENTKMQV